MYECKLCNYTTERKSSMDKHNTTIKHLDNVNNYKFCNTTI